MIIVAIIGGGPGGLISAYLLQEKCKNACDVTLFEATGRLVAKFRPAASIPPR